MVRKLAHQKLFSGEYINIIFMWKNLATSSKLNDGTIEQSEVEENDSYWERPGTSTLFSKNSLWDGLFSPAAGPSNLFELTNDFQKQIATKPMNETRSSNSTPDAIKNGKLAMATSESTTTLTDELNFVSIKERTPSISTASSDGHSHSSETPKKKFTTAKLTTTGSTISTHESSNSLESQQTASDVTVHLDYARLKSEHRKLKKYFENAYDNRYKTPPVTETIRRLSKCEQVPLDFYKSKKEKLDLLDAALELDDWDVVVTVLLFLKRTWNNSLFRQCLLERPAAAQHYVTYLRESDEKQELLDTLFGLGRITEASMFEFAQACRCKDPKKKLELLKNCLLSGFSHPELTNEKRHLEEWITLLETHFKQ